ncbi:MAG: response regulator transcription factor [Ignavibacteria bacterium]|nr:response regulator transcription factor [Ignavibacteria bacterium]
MLINNSQVAYEPGLGRSPIRVLLVDDSTVLLQSIDKFLSTFPWINVVGHALSGEEAINMVQETQIDLVLIDIKMPGIGGLEATSVIKARASPPRVLILTLYNNPSYREAAHDAGADGFILKSYFVSDLIPMVRELFSINEHSV